MTRIWASLLLTLPHTRALSCTSELLELGCLPVFSHSPSTLSKCYCTSRCPSIEQLRNTCFSGQLQTDPCGICLQCAPGYGETCGGFGNSEGTCSGGLGCLVRYEPGREVEHNKTGTCVTEQGEECRKPKSGVSCRPGQIGVPADFVFCPEPTKCQKPMSTRQSGSSTGFLFGSQGSRRQAQRGQAGPLASVAQGQGGQGGSLVSSFLQELQASFPSTIGDTIRENLGRKK